MQASDLSPARRILMLAALFLSVMCTMGDMVVTPVVADLYTVFADAPEALINLGVTGPAIAGLPFCFLGGWLADHMDKKVLMVVGFAIFVVSSCLGAAIVNIYYFVAMRLLATGVGWGITNSAALAILADLYQDEEAHGKMVGYYNVAGSLIASVLSIAGGFAAVAAGVWTGAFRVYLISIPVLIMLIAFLPSLPPRAKVAEEHGEKAEEVPAGWWKRLIPLNIQVFVVAVCYFIALYMIAVYVDGAAVGDEAFIGTAASAMTLASAVGAFVFGFAYAKFRNAVYLPFVLIMGICFVVMSFFPSAAVTLLCCVVLGFSWPFYFCYFYTRCTEIVPGTKAGTATGIVALSDGLGAALCSYFIIWLIGSVGGGNVLAVWWIPGVILIAAAVVSAIHYFTVGKKNA